MLKTYTARQLSVQLCDVKFPTVPFSRSCVVPSAEVDRKRERVRERENNISHTYVREGNDLLELLHKITLLHK